MKPDWEGVNMKAIQFIQMTVSGMHQALINDVHGLGKEQLKWKPAAEANPIAFLFWHAARVEDKNVSEWQNKDSVWKENRWYLKLKLDEKAYGTGFEQADVNKITKLPFDQVVEYAEKVFRDTEIYIQSLDEDKLDYAPNSERPNWTVAMMLNSFVIAHGWWHLGEIRYLKGLQGMPWQNQP
jgi:hypothetical protein